MKKILAASLVVAFVLTGCNTIKGVGKDVSGDFQDGILQPVWSVSVNGSEKEAQEKIIPVVQNVLTDMKIFLSSLLAKTIKVVLL